MTKYCNNCQSQKESWAEYSDYNYSETFARDERCWSCNRWTLSRKISENAPAISPSIFFNPFALVALPLSGLNSLSRLFVGKDLEEYIQRRIGISNEIMDVVPFDAWWNKNLATVINGSNSYTVWLLVYEPALRNRSEILEKLEISSGYDKYNLDSAKNKASSLRNELNGDNPILVIYPSDNSYCSFSNIIKETYIKETKLPVSTMESGWDEHGTPLMQADHPDNPDEHLKPLDIVKVDKSMLENKYYHFGIYLGNRQVCHFTDPNSKKSPDGMKIRINDWNNFLSGGGFDLIRIHPIIPFRHYREIAKNIAWDEANDFGLRRYCLANNNCEHYVNSRVFGLNWSQQVAERPSKASNWARYMGTNNGENGNFNLKDRLSQNLNQQTNNYCSQEIERKYLQEIYPKQNCQIM